MAQIFSSPFLRRQKDHLFEFENAQIFNNWLFHVAYKKHVLFRIRDILFKKKNKGYGYFKKRLTFLLWELGFWQGKGTLFRNIQRTGR